MAEIYDSSSCLMQSLKQLTDLIHEPSTSTFELYENMKFSIHECKQLLLRIPSIILPNNINSQTTNTTNTTPQEDIPPQSNPEIADLCSKGLNNINKIEEISELVMESQQRKVEHLKEQLNLVKEEQINKFGEQEELKVKLQLAQITHQQNIEEIVHNLKEKYVCDINFYKSRSKGYQKALGEMSYMYKQRLEEIEKMVIRLQDGEKSEVESSAMDSRASSVFDMMQEMSILLYRIRYFKQQDMNIFGLNSEEEGWREYGGELTSSPSNLDGKETPERYRKSIFKKTETGEEHRQHGANHHRISPRNKKLLLTEGSEYRRSQLLEQELKAAGLRMPESVEQEGEYLDVDVDADAEMGGETNNLKEEMRKLLFEGEKEGSEMFDNGEMEAFLNQSLDEGELMDDNSDLNKGFIASKSLSCLHQCTSSLNNLHLGDSNNAGKHILLNNSKVLNKLSSKLHKDLSKMSLSQREKLVFQYIYGPPSEQIGNDVKLEDLLKVSANSTHFHTPKAHKQTGIKERLQKFKEETDGNLKMSNQDTLEREEDDNPPSTIKKIIREADTGTIGETAKVLSGVIGNKQMNLNMAQRISHMSLFRTHSADSLVGEIYAGSKEYDGHYKCKGPIQNLNHFDLAQYPKQVKSPSKLRSSLSLGHLDLSKILDSQGFGSRGVRLTNLPGGILHGQDPDISYPVGEAISPDPINKGNNKCRSDNLRAPRGIKNYDLEEMKISKNSKGKMKLDRLLDKLNESGERQDSFTKESDLFEEEIDVKLNFGFYKRGVGECEEGKSVNIKGESLRVGDERCAVDPCKHARGGGIHQNTPSHPSQKSSLTPPNISYQGNIFSSFSREPEIKSIGGGRQGEERERERDRERDASTRREPPPKPQNPAPFFFSYASNLSNAPGAPMPQHSPQPPPEHHKTNSSFERKVNYGYQHPKEKSPSPLLRPKKPKKGEELLFPPHRNGIVSRSQGGRHKVTHSITGITPTTKDSISRAKKDPSPLARVPKKYSLVNRPQALDMGEESGGRKRGKSPIIINANYGSQHNDINVNIKIIDSVFGERKEGRNKGGAISVGRERDSNMRDSKLRDSKLRERDMKIPKIGEHSESSSEGRGNKFRATTSGSHNIRGDDLQLEMIYKGTTNPPNPPSISPLHILSHRTPKLRDNETPIRVFKGKVIPGVNISSALDRERTNSSHSHTNNNHTNSILYPKKSNTRPDSQVSRAYRTRHNNHSLPTDGRRSASGSTAYKNINIKGKSRLQVKLKEDTGHNNNNNHNNSNISSGLSAVSNISNTESSSRRERVELLKDIIQHIKKQGGGTSREDTPIDIHNTSSLCGGQVEGPLVGGSVRVSTPASIHKIRLKKFMDHKTPNVQIHIRPPNNSQFF